MNEVLKTIAALHSTHGNFTSRPIGDDTVKAILDACVRTANASNRQSYSIVVIRGEDRVQNILCCGAKSPVALLFCVDFNRLRDIGEHLGYESDEDYLFSFLTGHIDACIAAQTAVVAAASLGVSSLFTNSIIHTDRKNISDLYEQLNLPEKHFFPAVAVLFGYEDKAPDHKKGRLDSLGVVHYDAYKKLTDEQKEAVIKTMNDPENHFGDTGGCDTYLEYYYTKWRRAMPKDEMKRIDEPLYEKLKSFIH